MLLNAENYKLPLRTAFAKSAAVKSSVQKLSLVANLVCGMPVSEALLQLRFLKKKVAKDVLSVLRAAISNAENNFNYDIDKLYISKILRGKAFNLRRMRAGARGRSRAIKKCYSKMTIFVSEQKNM